MSQAADESEAGMETRSAPTFQIPINWLKDHRTDVETTQVDDVRKAGSINSLKRSEIITVAIAFQDVSKYITAAPWALEEINLKINPMNSFLWSATGD